MKSSHAKADKVNYRTSSLLLCSWLNASGTEMNDYPTNWNFQLKKQRMMNMQTNLAQSKPKKKSMFVMPIITHCVENY